MGKALLLSIQPEWVEKILNKNKRYEIRKKIPADYRGWVYIYCTKDSNKRYQLAKYKDTFAFGVKSNEEIIGNKYQTINGKVVARFWCDKIETIRRYSESDGYGEDACYCFDYWDTRRLPQAGLDVQNGSCLTARQLTEYANGKKELYAIHISKLEIFDKPKELNEFKVYKHIKTFNNLSWLEKGEHLDFGINKPLTKAPQNYCYVEELVNGK